MIGPLDWTRAIQLTIDTKLESNIHKLIRRYLKKGILIDVPCYIGENSVKTFMNKYFKIPNALRELVFRDKGTLQLIASFMKNPNAPNTFGVPPIIYAARDGNIDLIKILAPLCDNPNVPSSTGWVSAIDLAIQDGYLDIAKILIPLTSNPNFSPCPNGWTPMHKAAAWGLTEIIKLLAPLTANPNAPNPRNGKTPMSLAKKNGHQEVINVLKNYL